MEKPEEFGDYLHGNFKEETPVAAADRARKAAAIAADRFAWEVKRKVGGDDAKARALATALGYSKTDTVRAMLRGQTHMSLATMFEIAEILDIPLHVLIGDKMLP